MSESTQASTMPRFLPYALLVLLSLPLVFYGLGSYSVVNGDEAHYHGVARNMVATGNWMRLEYTGEHRVYDTFMNAPIQYWARAAVITVFGTGLWSMRILSAVFALLSVLLTCWAGERLVSRRAGLIAGLVQLTTFQFLYMHSGRTGELEPVLCFVFLGLALLFHRAVVDGKSFVPHHLGLVLLANLKLPLVIVPIAAELLFFAVDRESRARFLRYTVLGLAIVPFGLIWHVVNYVTLGDEARAVFSRMGDQASGEVETRGGPGKNLFFYLRTTAFGAWPWTLALPVALGSLFAGLRSKGGSTGERAARDARLAKLLLVFPLAVYGFFGVVSKFYPWYVLPAYPFFALWIGLFLDRELASPRRAWVTALAATLAAGLLGVTVLTYAPFEERALKDLLSDFGPVIALRSVGGLPGWVLLIGSGSVAGVFAWTMIRFRGVAAARTVAGVCGLALLACALLRVTLPLTRVQHFSEMEQTRAAIDEALAQGLALDFPIEIRETGNLRVRHYFGDDFRIVKAPGRRSGGPAFLLIGPGRTPGNPPSFRTAEEHRKWERQATRE